MPIKQQITPQIAERVYFSLQKMAVLSQVLLIENQTHCDTDFRVPFINNFAKRIREDSKSIQNHLQQSGRIVIKSRDNETLEEYAGEIWRIIDLLVGLDISLIKEFADNIDKEFKQISA